MLVQSYPLFVLCCLKLAYCNYVVEKVETELHIYAMGLNKPKQVLANDCHFVKKPFFDFSPKSRKLPEMSLLINFVSADYYYFLHTQFKTFPDLMHANISFLIIHRIVP